MNTTTQLPPRPCPFGGLDDEGRCLDLQGRERHVQTVAVSIDDYQPRLNTDLLGATP